MSHPDALQAARQELALAKSWMNDKGHTLSCGEQDAALDRIASLEDRVRDLEHDDLCWSCNTYTSETGRTTCKFCNA